MERWHKGWVNRGSGLRNKGSGVRVMALVMLAMAVVTLNGALDHGEGRVLAANENWYLRLFVNGQEAAELRVDVANAYPGWSASYALRVENGYPLGGALRLVLTDVVNSEVACSQNETSQLAAGCEGGQLSANVEVTLRDDARTYFGPATVDEVAAAGWLDVGDIGGSGTRDFTLVVSLPGSAGPETMTDQVRFDVDVQMSQPDPTPTPGPNNPSTDGGATPSAEVLALPAPTPSYTSEVLAPLLPNAGEIPLASLGLLAALGLLFTAVGIRLGR
ncbi:MAG: hypothetical protein ACUVX1_08025 [Chloroflexota bacterium]